MRKISGIPGPGPLPGARISLPLYSFPNQDAMDVGSLLTRLRQEIYTYSELVWLMKG